MIAQPIQDKKMPLDRQEACMNKKLPLIFQRTLSELAPSRNIGGLLQFQRAVPSTAPDKCKVKTIRFSTLPV